MSYNKSYNTRHSGRYNTPGQFVAAGEQMQQQQMHQPPQQQQQFGQMQRTKLAPPPPPPQVPQNLQQVPIQQPEDEDVVMKQEATDDQQTERPSWMKSKLAGIKKISKKERRRRQNEHLRRLLVPKNALMVLNEMMLHEQVTNVSNQFKVEPAENSPFFKSQNKHTFRADLTLDGQNYKGYGENKLTARNAAAEQAIRDLIIKRLTKVYNNEANGEGSQPEGEGEETLPMIQIASFALHKLFSEWEYDGHKVPQLKPPTSVSTSEAEAADALAPAPRPPVVKKPKELPVNASAMHPCMLLTYMRPAMEYSELAVEGDRPQNMTFTMGVEVDGSTYVGKAHNKKEARKAAARAACQALFGVKFDEIPSASAPVAPPADN